MNKRIGARVAPVVGLGLLALSVAVFVAAPDAGQARAADQKGAVVEKVAKLAAAVKAGDKAAIKQQVAALAKQDLDEVMDAFKPRSRGGLGVGKKGTITPDGIELKLQALGRDTLGAAALTKEAEALEEMSWVIAAVAEVALVKGPPPKSKGTKSDWLMWSQEMRDVSASLRQALKSNSGAELKKVASKLYNNCSACHATFKVN